MRLYSTRPSRYIIQFRAGAVAATERDELWGQRRSLFLYRGCMYVCRYALHMYDKRIASSFIKLSHPLAHEGRHGFPPGFGRHRDGELGHDR
jgi:hypothetical protein